MTKRTYWPAVSDQEGWAALANRVMQLEMLDVDRAENESWVRTMRALIAEHLDYKTFTERRMAALKERIRKRKLDQTNLRWKYGLKGRSERLVRADTRRYLGAKRS